jgi:hypothetical protein
LMQIPHGAVDAVGQSEVVCIHDESAHWDESTKCCRCRAADGSGGNSAICQCFLP